MKEELITPERVKPPLSHVALVMDGNRRWAKFHNLPVIEGHREGERRIEPIVKRCQDLGIQVATFYTLSVDNLERPQEEVMALIDVLRKGLPLVFRKIEEENGRFCALGNIERFPADIQTGLQEAMLKSQDRKGITVNLAMAYSGRDEIKRAVQRIVRLGYKEEEITEELIGQCLDTAGQPDPDLVIRTGGRYRLSGFLPWQGVYAEIYFTDILWPDFSVEEFNKAISWHKEQVRTFGR